MGGLANGISRFYSIASEKKDIEGYLKDSCLLMALSVFAVGIIAMIIIISLKVAGYSYLLGLAAAAFVFSALTGCNTALNGIQAAARQRAIVALHDGMNICFKICLSAIMIFYFGASSTVIMIAYGLSILLTTSSQLFFSAKLLQLRKINFSKVAMTGNWRKQIWSFSWPFASWGLFTWAQLASDRWALQAFTVTHEVGQYAVALQLGYTPIGIVTGLVVSFIGPILYQRSGAATDYNRNASVHRLTWRLTWLSLAMTVFVFLITLLLHERIFQLLVAGSFRQSSWLLPWMVLSGGLFSVGQVLSLKFMSEMKTAAMATVKIGTALLGIVCNVFGAWQFGTTGVVAGLLIFSILYLAWIAWLATMRAQASSQVLADAK